MLVVSSGLSSFFCSASVSLSLVSPLCFLLWFSFAHLCAYTCRAPVCKPSMPLLPGIHTTLLFLLYMPRKTKELCAGVTARAHATHATRSYLLPCPFSAAHTRDDKTRARRMSNVFGEKNVAHTCRTFAPHTCALFSATCYSRHATRPSRRCVPYHASRRDMARKRQNKTLRRHAPGAFHFVILFGWLTLRYPVRAPPLP